MRITVMVHSRDKDVDGPIYEASLPYPSAEFVECAAQCPHCGAPLKVSGAKGSREVHEPKIYEVAICRDCDEPVGTICVEMETLFGFDEDNRVLNGRPRVY